MEAKKIAFVCSIDAKKSIIEKQLKIKNISNIDVYDYSEKPTDYDIVKYDIKQNKEFAELLDLSGSVGRHGFHWEPYIPPQYGDKAALLEEKAKTETNIINTLVEEEPTEITREIIDVAVEEIKRKSEKINDLTMNELSALFNITYNLTKAFEIAFEINKKVFGTNYKDGDILFAVNPCLDMISEFPEYKLRLIKTFKTAIQNKVKKRKKLVAMHYFPEWLKTVVPYSFNIDVDIIDKDIPF